MTVRAKREVRLMVSPAWPKTSRPHTEYDSPPLVDVMAEREGIVGCCRPYTRYALHRMAVVHVRDVPEEIVDALKRRALAHHRSLECEVLRILEDAAIVPPFPVDLEPMTLTMAKGKTQGSWRRESQYDDDGR